jgi:PBP1b-binding outer membrane lipoprotein LpoB
MKISKNLVLGSIVAISAVVFSGCSAANVSSEMRTPTANFNMETSCVELDMRDNAAMAETFKKYQGWRVFYISEYTSEHKVGTSGSVCFERPKQ